MTVSCAARVTPRQNVEHSVGCCVADRRGAERLPELHGLEGQVPRAEDGAGGGWLGRRRSQILRPRLHEGAQRLLHPQRRRSVFLSSVVQF